MSTTTDVTRTAGSLNLGSGTNPGTWIGSQHEYDQIKVEHVTATYDRVTVTGTRRRGGATQETWRASDRVTLTITEADDTVSAALTAEVAEITAAYDVHEFVTDTRWVIQRNASHTFGSIHSPVLAERLRARGWVARLDADGDIEVEVSDAKRDEIAHPLGHAVRRVAVFLSTFHGDDVVAASRAAQVDGVDTTGTLTTRDLRTLLAAIEAAA